jgi:tetratricopeptide (TPR) repeat protein
MAIQLNPGLAEAYNLRGIVLEEMGRMQEAVAAYRQAVRLDPGFLEARENLQEIAVEPKEEKGESLTPEVEELLRILQSGTLYLARRDAAEQLGKVGTSSPRIIRVLRAAQESDPYPDVRRAAAKSLQAPVHKEYLKQNPDLEETEKVRSRALEPEEVELLLPILQPGSHYLAREAAAGQLGNAGTSSPRVVRALIEASESDPHPTSGEQPPDRFVPLCTRSSCRDTRNRERHPREPSARTQLCEIDLNYGSLALFSVFSQALLLAWRLVW